MKKKQTAAPKKPVRPARAAAAKKKTPPKRAGAGPSMAADQADSEFAIGPYGDLISKKDLGLLVTTRTRMS